MQTYRLTAFLLFALFAACNQQPDKQQQIELQKKIYREAKKYNDFPVARTALYTILALNPADSTYVDSLFYFYAKTMSAPQAVALGNELIAKRLNDTTMLELLAISKQAIRYHKEALEDYEKLYGKTKSPVHLYQMAALQYELGRVGECQRSIDKILGMEVKDTDKVEITFGQNVQLVKVKAAALNIYGILLLQDKQTEEAIKVFEKAIEVDPEFELPKGNIQLIKESAEKAKAAK